MGRKKKIEKIEEIFRGKDIRKKLEVLEEVAKMENSFSLNLLFTCLNETSWHLRNKAAILLGRMGEKAYERLIEVLEKGVWYAKAGAALALGEMKKLDAIRHLIKYLDDKNETVKKSVEDAIRNIVREKPVEFVEEFLPSLPEEEAELIRERIKKLEPSVFEI
ncbi:hypothetical protein DRQ18_03860 [bacterium]|nr:MAG: hypothetical protein DRQ18_03860 [bacterium]